MSNTDDKDAILIERVQHGDQAAFNLLVSKYQYRMKYLASRFAKDPRDQEDIVQEAFIKAYRALSGFRGESTFYTWIYRITVNVAKNHLLANSRKPPNQDVDVGDVVDGVVFSTLLNDTDTPDRMLNSANLVVEIHNAIECLPDDLKQAIIMRELDGLSYADIAVVMDCPVGTIRSRIFRAREAIENKIAHLLD